MNRSDIPDDLDALDDGSLKELWDEVAEETLAWRDLNKEIAAKVDERNTKAAARDRLAGMTDKEREAFIALAQSVETEGIETEEVVGAQDAPEEADE